MHAFKAGLYEEIIIFFAPPGKPFGRIAQQITTHFFATN
jgi:hypothetical protein